MPRARVAAVCLFVFAASAALIFFTSADIFHPSMDEGIYLEGGARVQAGQVPYRDFFAYTGPLIYWVQGALASLFGRDLMLLRLPVALSIGLMALGICWPLAGLRSPALGAVTASVFFGILLPSYFRFTTGHRWLSAGLLSLALGLAVAAFRSPRPRRWWTGTGAALAAAAWATPTFVVPIALVAFWLLAARERRSHLLPLLAGVTAVSAPAVVCLAAQSALVPMLDSLLWAGRQYSRANSVPYAYYAGVPIFGGLGYTLSALRQVGPPIVMPLLLLAAAIAAARRQLDPASSLVAVVALGSLLTAWPRWDVKQLIWVTPPFYVLAALWLNAIPQRVVRLAIAVCALSAAGLCGLKYLSEVGSFSYFQTRAGMLRRHESDANAIEALEKRVTPGSTLFVFPYLPVMGYLLDTRNPTTYAYLQPGMMSSHDEATALAQLTARPPRFILRQYLPDKEVLTVWPNSDPALLPLASIQLFIDTWYTPVQTVSSDSFRVTLYEHRPASGRLLVP